MSNNVPTLLQKLPLAQHASEILAHIQSQRNLLLTAPTGTGKSSFLPWLLHEQDQARIAVLQPRRIAALSLANFLARCMEQDTGATVGYNFRFESKQSASTRILFQTYGSFMQQCLRGFGTKWDWVIFDEFHERRAEMDLLLAWLLTWQKAAPFDAPRIAVLSAELNRQSLETLMEVSCLRVESPNFPVQILHQDPKPAERLDQQVLRAMRTLQGNQVWNTTLVFLPGKSEIQSAYNTLDEAWGKSVERPTLLKLFGGQELAEQTQIFADTVAPRIILTTNIAETSLTIPQVTAVIDSGFERATDFDQVRKISVLRLNRIALQNAIQRSGRAGRTRPGACIRLWSERDEAAMPREIIPEILRSRIQPWLLMRAALAQKIQIAPDRIAWPTAPPVSLCVLAQQELVALELMNAAGTITALGLQTIDLPLQSLELARMLALHKAPPPLLLACCAWLDGGQDSAKESTNLLNLAHELLAGARGIPREIALGYKRLLEWAGRQSQASSTTNDEVVNALLEAFPHALATTSESGKAYRLGDSLSILLDAKKTGNSPAILAFQLLRSGSGNLQQISRCIFVPVSESLLHNGAQAEEHWELLWRSGQERFTGLCIRTLGTLEVERREMAPQDASPLARKVLIEKTTAAWAEKMGREDLSHLWMGDGVKTLLAKMKWAAQSFPEFELPQWTSEDFELIMDEFTSGIFLQRDLEETRFRRIIEDYFGTHMLGWLQRTFPDILHLPSGRIAHYSYAEPELGPIEISARVADFFGMHGKHTIAEGRVEVRYDLLAPNRRTVQKTWDLTGFWQNTYPEVRKELRGRYPRHPWPEDPNEAER